MSIGSVHAASRFNLAPHAAGNRPRPRPSEETFHGQMVSALRSRASLSGKGSNGSLLPGAPPRGAVVGTFTVHDEAVSFSGKGFQGSYDKATGTFTGTVAVGGRELSFVGELVDGRTARATLEDGRSVTFSFAYTDKGPEAAAGQSGRFAFYDFRIG